MLFKYVCKGLKFEHIFRMIIYSIFEFLNSLVYDFHLLHNAVAFPVKIIIVGSVIKMRLI